MSGLARRIWLLFVAALSLVPACGGGDGTGANPAPPVVDGVWVFREVLADAANAISCQDNGLLTISQAAGTFSGDYQQTGACVWPSGPADNSGAFSLSDGSVDGTAIGFIEPGPVPCTYQGSVAGSPPNALSGTVICDGVVTGPGPGPGPGPSTHFHFTGTWQADAVGDGPQGPSTGGLSVVTTTTGTNLPAALDVEVATTQGLIALFTAAPNGISTSPRLMSGDYEVRLVAPGNCQVIGINPVSVNIPGSSRGAFTVTCT